MASGTAFAMEAAAPAFNVWVPFTRAKMQGVEKYTGCGQALSLVRTRRDQSDELVDSRQLGAGRFVIAGSRSTAAVIGYRSDVMACDRRPTQSTRRLSPAIIGALALFLCNAEPDGGACSAAPKAFLTPDNSRPLVPTTIAIVSLSQSCFQPYRIHLLNTCQKTVTKWPLYVGLLSECGVWNSRNRHDVV